MRRNGNASNGSRTVPVARRMRKLSVPAGISSAIAAKNIALNPKAANGKAVAVPRDSGKFRAAIASQQHVDWSGPSYSPALIDAVNAVQLPAPVKKEKRHIKPTLYAPGPALYAMSCRQPCTSPIGHVRSYLEQLDSIRQQKE